jgi:hypothetical protein
MCIVVATWTIEQVASWAKDTGLDENEGTKLVTSKVSGKVLLSLIHRDKLESVIPPGPASLLVDAIMPTQSSSSGMRKKKHPIIFHNHFWHYFPLWPLLLSIIYKLILLDSY